MGTGRCVPPSAPIASPSARAARRRCPGRPCSPPTDPTRPSSRRTRRVASRSRSPRSGRPSRARRAQPDGGRARGAGSPSRPRPRRARGSRRSAPLARCGPCPAARPRRARGRGSPGSARSSRRSSHHSSMRSGTIWPRSIIALVSSISTRISASITRARRSLREQPRGSADERASACSKPSTMSRAYCLVELMRVVSDPAASIEPSSDLRPRRPAAYSCSARILVAARVDPAERLPARRCTRRRPGGPGRT